MEHSGPHLTPANQPLTPSLSHIVFNVLLLTYSIYHFMLLQPFCPQPAPSFFFTTKIDLAEMTCCRYNMWVTNFSFFVPHRKASFSRAELRGWAQPCSVGARFAALAGLQSGSQWYTFQCHLVSGWSAPTSGRRWLSPLFGQWITPPAGHHQGQAPSPRCGGGLQLHECQCPGSPDQPDCKCALGK